MTIPVGTPHYLNFIHALQIETIPLTMLQNAELTLLDTCGVTAAGSRMKAARLMNSFARRHYAHAPHVAAEGKARLLFDGNSVSPGGAALATGQAADSMDAHDGRSRSQRFPHQFDLVRELALSKRCQTSFTALQIGEWSLIELSK